jgi:hypothetical protein
MNQKQKSTLISTAAVVGIMILFPPYIIKNFKQAIIQTGYGFLFQLPVHAGSYKLPATVNVATLLIQIIAVLVIGVLIYFSFRETQ